jgi:hypothetical protein
MGEIARARIVTDEETEIFPSELLSGIVVLLAIRNCLHNIKMEVTVCIPSAWRIGCTSFRLPSWTTVFLLS